MVSREQPGAAFALLKEFESAFSPVALSADQPAQQENVEDLAKRLEEPF